VITALIFEVRENDTPPCLDNLTLKHLAGFIGKVGRNSNRESFASDSINRICIKALKVFEEEYFFKNLAVSPFCRVPEFAQLQAPLRRGAVHLSVYKI